MARVTVLWRDEPLQMDADRLAEIYVRMGEDRANEKVSLATEEMAITLDRLKSLMRAGRYSALSDGADTISCTAEMLGLSSLSFVARDVAGLARQKDRVALSACMARLDRVASRSLKMVWDVQEISSQ